MNGVCLRCGMPYIMQTSEICNSCANELIQEIREDEYREEYRREMWKDAYGED